MKNDVQVAFRMPRELVERLDAEAVRMRTENPGMRITRADVVRVLLTRALDQFDGKAGREQGAGLAST